MNRNGGRMMVNFPEDMSAIQPYLFTDFPNDVSFYIENNHYQYMANQMFPQ